MSIYTFSFSRVFVSSYSPPPSTSFKKRKTNIKRKKIRRVLNKKVLAHQYNFGHPIHIDIGRGRGFIGGILIQKEDMKNSKYDVTGVNPLSPFQPSCL